MSYVSQSDLRLLQDAVLEAVLLGRGLPGSTTRFVMPDLDFVTAGDSVYLLDENLSGPMSTTLPQKTLRIVTGQSLASLATGTAFLRFAPAETSPDSVVLTLEARLVRGPSEVDLGLSNVQVRFTKSAGSWVAENPRFSAV
jgi:hypothetical protein